MNGQELINAVAEIVQSGKTAQATSIALYLGAEVIDVRENLKIAVDTKKIDRHGKARGTFYLPHGMEVPVKAEEELDEAILESLVKGVQKLGATNATKLSKHLTVDVMLVRQGLKVLVDSKRLARHGKARGTKYTMPGEAPPAPMVAAASPSNPDRVRQPKASTEISTSPGRHRADKDAVDSTRKFEDIDGFMREALNHLPKATTFTVLDLSKELASYFPGSGFNQYDISSQVAKWVARGRLNAKLVEDDGKRYHFFTT